MEDVESGLTKKIVSNNLLVLLCSSGNCYPCYQIIKDVETNSYNTVQNILWKIKKLLKQS